MRLNSPWERAILGTKSGLKSPIPTLASSLRSPRSAEWRLPRRSRRRRRAGCLAWMASYGSASQPQE